MAAAERPNADKQPNDRQMAFARHYVETLNATKAATLAGYSERTAAVKGCELRKDPRVRAEIDRLFEATSKGRGEVKRRIENISESSLEEFLRIEGDEDSENVDFSLARAKKANKLGFLREITITKRPLPGDAGGTETKIRLKVADPLPALKILAKHHGIIENDADEAPEDNGEDDDATTITDEEIKIEADL